MMVEVSMVARCLLNISISSLLVGRSLQTKPQRCSTVWRWKRMREETNSLTPLHAHRKRRPGQRMTAAERKIAQDHFIDSFKLNANVTVACTQANISRDTLYKWLEHDQLFSI